MLYKVYPSDWLLMALERLVPLTQRTTPTFPQDLQLFPVMEAFLLVNYVYEWSKESREFSSDILGYVHNVSKMCTSVF